MYNIKEVSELMGISPHTLRYYEKIGLLEFVKRNEQGVREFSESDLLTINTIYCLKQTGMPLKEIKHYLALIKEGFASVDERAQIMLAQKKKVKAQIKVLEQALETIENKLYFYKEAKKQGSLAVCTDEREQMLERLLKIKHTEQQ